MPVPASLVEAELFLEQVRRVAGGAAAFERAWWNADGTAVFVRSMTARGQVAIEQALRDSGFPSRRRGVCLVEVAW